MTDTLGLPAWERYRGYKTGIEKAPRRSLRRREFLAGYDRGASLVFDAARIGAVLSEALTQDEIARWFTTPHPTLAGQTPIEVLAQGEVRLVDYAAGQA